MKKTKEIKNPLPKKINLTFGFDVSTTSTGYALLLNGKPFQLSNGKYSIGQIHMLKQEEYKGQKSFTDRTPETKLRDVKYSNYGDRMFHGSHKAIQEIKSMVYQSVKGINDIIGNLKRKNAAAENSKQAIRHEIPEVENFNIVFEISEIPNYGKFAKGRQTITSVRKLALYVGAVQEAISSVLHNAAFHFVEKAQVKMIKPTEWQTRLFEKQGDREKTKIKSVEIANKKIKEWGLQEIPVTMDDMADAINIASVAHLVRDNVFASAQAVKKAKDVAITYNRDIEKTKAKIHEYKDKGLELKNEFINNIIWTIDKDYSQLNTKDKAKFTKYSNCDLQAAQEKEPTKYLTPAQQRKLEEWTIKVIELEDDLKRLRNRKVIKNETN